MSKYQLHLVEALAITLKMHEAAKENNWDDVIMLEACRQKEMVAMEMGVPKQLNESDKEEISENLKHIIAMNKKIFLLSSDEKVACFNKFSHNKNNQKAFSAYSVA